MENKTVLVVVVTYNRQKDLSICIEALKEQSYPYIDVLVVNNGSTDGTKEWLSSRDDIIVINQDNLGGAGGFYTGMQYMMDNGYDWLVLMDDDGLPHRDEISNLLESYDGIYQKEGEVILNALVIDKEDYKHTSFNWKRGSGRSTNVQDLQKEKYFPDIHPFNGTLIGRRTIEKIGLIKKEMFIWGDEKEYMARALHNGIGLFTVTSAMHFHPKEQGLMGNVFPLISKYQIVIKPRQLSHNFYRNEAYIYSHYPEKKNKLLKFFLAYTIRFVSHLDFTELRKFWVFFKKGVDGIF